MLEFVCVTDSGTRTKHNEDNLLVFDEVLPIEHSSLEVPRHYVFDSGNPVVAAVFDGVGGEPCGELASYAAAVGLRDIQVPESPSSSWLEAVMQALNGSVCKQSARDGIAHMGTTAVIACVTNTHIVVGNVGDSAAFLFRGGELYDMYEPHTNEAIIEELGLADKRPGLTQYLGIEDEHVVIEPFVVEFFHRAGDLLLLSSDGLLERLGRDDIGEVLRADSDVATKVSDLRDRAIERGTCDNVTIVLCRIA